MAVEAGLTSREQGHVSVENEVSLYGYRLTFSRKPHQYLDHSTPCLQGLTNVRAPRDGAGITMRNGDTKCVAAMANIGGA